MRVSGACCGGKGVRQPPGPSPESPTSQVLGPSPSSFRGGGEAITVGPLVCLLPLSHSPQVPHLLPCVPTTLVLPLRPRHLPAWASACSCPRHQTLAPTACQERVSPLAPLPQPPPRIVSTFYPVMDTTPRCGGCVSILGQALGHVCCGPTGPSDAGSVRQHHRTLPGAAKTLWCFQ